VSRVCRQDSSAGELVCGHDVPYCVLDFLKAMVVGIVKYSLYFEEEYTVVDTLQ